MHTLHEALKIFLSKCESNYGAIFECGLIEKILVRYPERDNPIVSANIEAYDLNGLNTSVNNLMYRYTILINNQTTIKILFYNSGSAIHQSWLTALINNIYVHLLQKNKMMEVNLSVINLIQESIRNYISKLHYGLTLIPTLIDDRHYFDRLLTSINICIYNVIRYINHINELIHNSIMSLSFNEFAQQISNYINSLDIPCNIEFEFVGDKFFSCFLAYYKYALFTILQSIIKQNYDYIIITFKERDNFICAKIEAIGNSALVNDIDDTIINYLGGKITIHLNIINLEYPIEYSELLLNEPTTIIYDILPYESPISITHKDSIVILAENALDREVLSNVISTLNFHQYCTSLSIFRELSTTTTGLRKFINNSTVRAFIVVEDRKYDDMYQFINTNWHNIPVIKLKLPVAFKDFIKLIPSNSPQINKKEPQILIINSCFITRFYLLNLFKSCRYNKVYMWNLDINEPPKTISGKNLVDLKLDPKSNVLSYFDAFLIDKESINLNIFDLLKPLNNKFIIWTGRYLSSHERYELILKGVNRFLFEPIDATQIEHYSNSSVGVHYFM